jgi:hypothetical protein
MKKHNLIARLTLVISIGLYLAALTQECYCTSMVCGGHWRGIYILALGAIGGIMSIAGLTWYANPLLWTAWSLINKQPKKALMFSIAATLLAASFLLFTEITDITPGRTAYITNYRLGYWLWLASAITTLTGCLLAYLTESALAGKTTKLIVLQVNFNDRCSGGIRLSTKGSLYKQGKQKVKLHEGAKAIIWDKDINDKQTDNLAVEALILYSKLDNCWIASFNYDDLKHESEREEPLLE